MGCFSFMCSVCGDPINSDSYSGEHCTLFLLQAGRVIEKMTGQYDSYGRVFKDGTCKDARRWDMPWAHYEAESNADVTVCELMFNSNDGDGIAAVHTDCLGMKSEGWCPTEASDRDPDQGWGEYRHPTEPGGTVPKQKPTVRLTGKDGNIYHIMAEVSRALRGANYERAEIEKFHEEVKSSQSYDGALQVVMRWAEVE